MTDTDKKIILDEGGEFMASVWKKTSAPVSYERSFYVDGDWVEVKVDFDKTRNGHKPARRAGDGGKSLESMADRSADA
jgi:hypothetical protein